MSNVGGGLLGRASSWGTNLWIGIVIVALLVFAANTGFSTVYGKQETNASALVADVSVKSQQLAVQAKDAVAGDQDAFAKFKDTRNAIDADIKNLQDGSFSAGVPSYRTAFGVSSGKATSLIAELDAIVRVQTFANQRRQQQIGLPQPLDDF